VQASRSFSFLVLWAGPQACQTITFSESQSCMWQISWPYSQVSAAFLSLTVRNTAEAVVEAWE